MGSKLLGRYNKTITIRVTEEQYERYRAYCMANKIALNELVRFAVDKATAGKDKNVNKLIELYLKKMS